MEKSQGDLAAARRLFTTGTEVPAAYQHPPLYEAWARMEEEAGDAERARELMGQAQALAARKQAARGRASWTQGVTGEQREMQRRRQGPTSQPAMAGAGQAGLESPRHTRQEAVRREPK